MTAARVTVTVDDDVTAEGEKVNEQRYWIDALDVESVAGTGRAPPLPPALDFDGVGVEQPFVLLLAIRLQVVAHGD